MVVCSNCGSPTIVKTSWTPANPGRKFFCCITRHRGCGFVDWAEGPSCERAVEVFRHFAGLAYQVRDHEEQASRMTSEIRQLHEQALGMAVKYTRLKMMLMFSWVFFISYVAFH
ncbi:uncharacterized protein At1g43920, Chloroplastic-like [Helianthus annuus]|uniref:uncharacterized protein At1g43920, Chloroplastic-like n=1 Tax=Helianthus annuus TaxID=4232 RepID=UPI000B8F11DB|nr:uncharacterized protein At1g43920, Chloroplastic-like [Helianthus annuus]